MTGPPAYPSSTWRERPAGFPRELMRRCAACGFDQPPIHFGSRGACFDCTTGVKAVRRRRRVPPREARVTDERQPAAEELRRQDPLGYAAVVASMSARQREAYGHALRGLGVAGVASRLGIQPPAASLLLKRIRALFNRAGIPMPRANSSRDPGAVPTVPAQVCFVPHPGATTPQPR